MGQSILVVEDEPGLVITLRDRLRSEGYGVETARDGKEALERTRQDYFDLIILDIMLPGRNGLDVCRDLRSSGINTPILMLTARSQTVDKVLGLRTGADDYMTKPFDMLELLARIEALFRRALSVASSSPTVCRFGPVRVDLERTEVLRDGKPVALSAMEFQLLRYLIAHRGITLSRAELLKEVWGYSGRPTTRTVDVHVAWLRQKLENDPKQPQFIRTVHGLGYKFAG